MTDQSLKKLYHKYKVEKTNGEPVDPNAQYFVLRVDTDPAAQAAMLTYAAKMEQAGEVEFAEQIRDWIANLPAVKTAGSKNANKGNYIHPPEDTILPQYICMTCKTVIGPVWDDYENQCSCGEYEYEVWRVAPTG